MAEQTDPIDRLLPDDERALTAAQVAGLLEADDALDTQPLVVETQQPPIIGKSWAFDFVAGRFFPSRTGGVVPTRGLETLRIWVEKCLRTIRDSHPVHDDEYGLLGGFDSVLGRQFDAGEVADLEQRITDAVLYHPRIESVADFGVLFDEDDETLWISFRVITDQGETLDIRTPANG